MNGNGTRRWASRVALATLLAGTTLLAGCYHPHHYRHHRSGGYHDRHHDGHRYERHRDRDHRHRRGHHRHHAGCGH